MDLQESTPSGAESGLWGKYDVKKGEGDRRGARTVLLASSTHVLFSIPIDTALFSMLKNVMQSVMCTALSLCNAFCSAPSRGLVFYDKLFATERKRSKHNESAANTTRRRSIMRVKRT